MDVIVSLNAGAENEAVEQVAFADRILLNKIDLATEPELVAVEQRLKGINAFAPIIRSEKSQVSVDQVLGIKAFDLKKTLEMDPEFLDTEGEHEHDDSVTSMSITTSGEVHMLLVNDWVGDVLKNLGNDIYRMKGVLAVAGSPKKFVYQAVHMIFDGVFEGEWGPDEPRGNKLVFIGKNLDKASLQEASRRVWTRHKQGQNRRGRDDQGLRAAAETRCSGRRSGTMWWRSRTSSSPGPRCRMLIRWARPRYISRRSGATRRPSRLLCRPGRRWTK